MRLDHFFVFNPSGKPLLESSASVAPLIMFAYLGLESATVPAGDVRDPERTIPRATLLGISAAALTLCAWHRDSDGRDSARTTGKVILAFFRCLFCYVGPLGWSLIAIAALISSVGALNGWTLLMGQVPMAAAQDGLFPAG